MGFAGVLPQQQADTEKVFKKDTYWKKIKNKK
jgi:hypothetical protein